MLDAMVTTAPTLANHRILASFGVVRGITVRSRSIVGNLIGALHSILGGNITVYTTLCERARADAYARMCRHAEAHGANAIVAMHYDATEVMAGITEVLCYGTAVLVEAESAGS